MPVSDLDARIRPTQLAEHEPCLAVVFLNVAQGAADWVVLVVEKAGVSYWRGYELTSGMSFRVDRWQSSRGGRRR